MKSHRLGTDIDGMGSQSEQEVGHDDRAFATGVNHITTVPVAKSKPVIKEGVGPFIPNNIQGPSAWHGEEPTQSAIATHDQYVQAEQMATHSTDVIDPPDYYPDPVPVIIVSPKSGAQSLTVGRSNMLTVDVTDVGSNGAPVLIVPKDEHRDRVTIRNEHATVGVRIGGEKGEAKQGFLLTAGDARDFHQQTAMYAWPADGTAVIPISFFAEYSRTV